MTERPAVVDRKPWDDCPVCRDHLTSMSQSAIDELTAKAKAEGTSRSEQTLAYMRSFAETHE